jgi:soluble lytic murein transglycosylase-like protein
VASLGTSARALERVHLRNGFDYDCARHESVGGNIRLYKDADGSSYQDIPQASVESVEPLPDPPKTPVVEAASVSTTVPSGTDIPALLSSAGEQHDIDVSLLASIMKVESNGKPNAVSRAGARGLMQLMPKTARDLGVDDAFRPDQNIAGGAEYLDELLKRYYDPKRDVASLRKAIAAYNAGPAAVDRYKGVPPYRETQAYVERVISEFSKLATKRKKEANPSSSALASVVAH